MKEKAGFFARLALGTFLAGCALVLLANWLSLPAFTNLGLLGIGLAIVMTSIDTLITRRASFWHGATNKKPYEDFHRMGCVDDILALIGTIDNVVVFFCNIC